MTHKTDRNVSSAWKAMDHMEPSLCWDEDSFEMQGNRIHKLEMQLCFVWGSYLFICFAFENKLGCKKRLCDCGLALIPNTNQPQNGYKQNLHSHESNSRMLFCQQQEELLFNWPSPSLPQHLGAPFLSNTANKQGILYHQMGILESF